MSLGRSTSDSSLSYTAMLKKALDGATRIKDASEEIKKSQGAFMIGAVILTHALTSMAKGSGVTAWGIAEAVLGGVCLFSASNDRVNATQKLEEADAVIGNVKSSCLKHGIFFLAQQQASQSAAEEEQTPRPPM